MDTERESLLKSDGSLGMEFAPDTPIFAPPREDLIRFEEEDPEGDPISFAKGAELENGLRLLGELLASWAQNQESIVRQMRNLADELDEVQHNCNISTTVGSSVGIVGGIATIVGIIAFPPLAIGGVIVGFTAAVSNTTTDVVKAVISKNKWKQVEDMIRRDEQLLGDVLKQVEQVERDAERNGFSFTEAPFFKMCASAGAAGATGVSGILARVVAVEAMSISNWDGVFSLLAEMSEETEAEDLRQGEDSEPDGQTQQNERMSATDNESSFSLHTIPSEDERDDGLSRRECDYDESRQPSERMSRTGSSSIESTLSLHTINTQVSERENDARDESVFPASDRWNPVVGDVSENRCHTIDWCKCKHCVFLSQPRECCCCQEYLSAENQLASTLRITHRKGSCVAYSKDVNFALDPRGIEYLAHMSEEQRNALHLCQDENEIRREIAFKKAMFALWGHQDLPRGVVLPACIVARVLNAYPPHAGDYKADLVKFRLLLAKWARHRETVVKQLRDMATHLDGVQKGCNISVVVGSSVGIASGIAGLVGLFVLTPLAVGGLVVGGVAAASNTTTGLVNIGIIKKKSNKAAALLKRDEKLLGEARNQFEAVQHYVVSSGSSPVVIKTAASAGAAGVAGIGVRLVAKQLACIGPKVAKGFAQAAAGVGIALDVITLILTARDVVKGSQSELANKLRDVANEVEEGEKRLLINAQEFLKMTSF